MINLLRADFYRVIKNKLVIVSLILAIVVPFVLAGAFYGLKELMKYLEPSSAEYFDTLFGARILIGTTFSFTNNLGIVFPVFAVIIVLSDVTSGMIRNKIILGYSRHKIFASLFLTTLTYCLVLIIAYASMTALASILFLGKGEITDEHARTIIYFYALGLLQYVMVAAISTGLSLTLLNSAGSIVLTVALCLVLGLVSQIFGLFDSSKFEHVVNFIPGLVMSKYQLGEIELIPFLEGVGGALIVSGLFYTLGTLAFNKKDMK